MANAAASGFFAWFHLEPAELPNRFRPTGEAFHDLVALDVRTNGPDERITSMALRLERRFIDDPRDGVFARDIMKSFLRAALPPDVLAAIPSLSDTVASIEDLSQSGTPVIVRQDALRAHGTPAHTIAYDVFLGREPVWSATSDTENGAVRGATVQMTNQINSAASGDATLVTEISAGAIR